MQDPALGAQGFEGWVSLMVLDYKLVTLVANRRWQAIFQELCGIMSKLHITALPSKILNMFEMDGFTSIHPHCFKLSEMILKDLSPPLRAASKLPGPRAIHCTICKTHLNERSALLYATELLLCRCQMMCHSTEAFIQFWKEFSFFSELHKKRSLDSWICTPQRVTAPMIAGWSSN